ncbi:MAG: DUF924 domain-containing protein [Desulfuromonas sp.]|nr:MAG: DUF924 domain-containing protein [Desulfuromonas sp.]
MQPEAENVLDFWFADLGSKGQVTADCSRLWFGKDEAVDRELADRFGHTVEAVGTGDLDAWAATALGRLALVLVCDQLPRNIYRDMPRAFAFDSRALRLAKAGIERGEDLSLGIAQRAFFYLPFEHAEDMAMQDLSVKLFAKLKEDGGDIHEKATASFLDYAEQHRVIIARFGRFPHRNRILGRDSTPEEVDFLRQPGSSF